MDTPQRDYSALREAHARALAELDQHVEQQKEPPIEAGPGQERISGTQRVAASHAERGVDHAPENEAPASTRDKPDYLDHAVAALDRLDRYLEQRLDRADAGDRSAAPTVEDNQAPERTQAERQSMPVPPHRDYSVLKEEHARALEATGGRADEDEVAPEVEPTRPTQLRAPGWTHHGGMVEQQTSALARDKFIRQRLARAALDRHIEETRGNVSVDTPDVAAGNDVERELGDDSGKTLELPHRANYAALKEEHSRVLDPLNRHADRDEMAEHQAAASARGKTDQERRAREALDRHIDETRGDHGIDTPDAGPDKADDRDRGDGGVERET